MTGFPGFIGRRLARRLLEQSDATRLTVLVEERMRTAAAELAAPWGERLEVVVGDIGERRLGLTDADWERLTGSVDTVFHLAAIYDLAVPLALAQRVNVDGTGNVIDFCRAATGLRRHVYVSTAYVAGRRRGTVYEHELVLGQDFKNHYESTKFQAEVWVRESMAAVPTTILRPAIVVGDSQSGETEKFDGPYYLLRAISQAAARDQAPMQFGRVGRAVQRGPGGLRGGRHGRRCHRRRHGGGDAAPGGPRPVERPRPPGNAEPGVRRAEPRVGRCPPGWSPNALRLATVRKLFSDTPRESIAYLNHPVTFDTRRAVELLAPHDLHPPVFGDYAANMVALLQGTRGRPGVHAQALAAAARAQRDGAAARQRAGAARGGHLHRDPPARGAGRRVPREPPAAQRQRAPRQRALAARDAHLGFHVRQRTQQQPRARSGARQRR